MSWVAAAVGVAGIGAGLYGANKQAKANKAAQQENARQQAEQNRIQWANYLMTRGLDPAGAKAGEIPANGRAINSRLPLYANVQRSRAQPGFRVSGIRPRLSAAMPAQSPAQPTRSRGLLSIREDYR